MKMQIFWQTAAVVVLAALGVGRGWAQEPEVEATESLGLAQKSRFAAGAAPVTIERTKIVPGTPLSVNSTMTKIISSSRGTSFGGILARYDTANFGKFFGSGSLAARPTTDRTAALDELGTGDNEVDNDVDVARMYPPRLALDFSEFPGRELASSEARSNLRLQIENVVLRFDVDPTVEELRVEPEGSTVVLRGRLQSARLALLLENVVGMQPGVERVVNEIEVLEPETQILDVFGRPIR